MDSRYLIEPMHVHGDHMYRQEQTRMKPPVKNHAPKLPFMLQGKSIVHGVEKWAEDGGMGYQNVQSSIHLSIERERERHSLPVMEE